MITAGILLAAGQARRFGTDKLAALLDGRPLIDFAAAAMTGARLDLRLVVGQSLAGLTSVAAQGGQAESLRAGVRAAQAMGAGRIVIALADMPLVDAALIDAVVARCPEGGASAAVDGVAMPPACFDAALFPALLSLSGDRGAGALLRGLPTEFQVHAPGRLADVDTPADLARLQSRLRSSASEGSPLGT